MSLRALLPRSVLLAAALLSTSAWSGPVNKPIAYELDGKQFEGVLVYDDAVKGPRPGLLLVPNWMGITEDNLAQAREVAGRQYVIFVADLYGKEVRPKDRTEAASVSGAVKGDRAVMRARTKRALDAFLSHPASKAAGLDPKRVGAIGFCFGGTAVIELAKTGTALGGVVSFHGGLDAAAKWDGRPAAPILALHGAEDPAVPQKDVDAFVADLRERGADWTLVHFGGAVHSFTDKKANVPGRNMYDARVARRAFDMMHDFFAQQFE